MAHDWLIELSDVIRQWVTFHEWNIVNISFLCHGDYWLVTMRTPSRYLKYLSSFKSLFNFIFKNLKQKNQLYLRNLSLPIPWPHNDISKIIIRHINYYVKHVQLKYKNNHVKDEIVWESALHKFANIIVMAME